MKITGELLKSERNRKNLSVQDVAFALKLSPKIISAIEAGETESLPAKTFIRGFVKSYAQFLKIDSDQVMRQFQEEMGSTQPIPKNIVSFSQPAENLQNKILSEDETTQPRKTKAAPNRSNTTASQSSENSRVLSEKKGSRSFVYIGIAVVLVILIVATNKVVDRYQKERVLDPQEISKVQPLTAASDGQGTAVGSSTPESVVDTSNPSSLDNNAAANLTTTPPTQSLQSTVATSTPANTSSEAEVDEGFEPSNGKPIEIIVEAKKDTEILYAKGNTKNFSRLKLSAKQVQVIRSTSGLHLKADDGGSIHMVVNGIDKGIAGPNNKPVRLSF